MDTTSIIYLLLGIYLVLSVWLLKARKDTVIFILPMGLLVLTTLTALGYWIFSAALYRYWLVLIAIDFLILLGVMASEQAAGKVSGASGWITFGWLMFHLLIAMILVLAKGLWHLWQYWSH